ncbi:MAG: glycine zipper 2TM domain-containing protein [Pseudomonadota bacterium]
MKSKALAALLTLLAAAGCTTSGTTLGTPNATFTGGAAGTALGLAIAGEDDEVEGALIGGLAGAALGSVVDQSRPRDCVYRDSAGRQFVAPCQ